MSLAEIHLSAEVSILSTVPLLVNKSPETSRERQAYCQGGTCHCHKQVRWELVTELRTCNKKATIASGYFLEHH